MVCVKSNNIVTFQQKYIYNFQANWLARLTCVKVVQGGMKNIQDLLFFSVNVNFALIFSQAGSHFLWLYYWHIILAECVFKILSRRHSSFASLITFLMIWCQLSSQTNHNWHIFVWLLYSKNVPVRCPLWLVSTPQNSSLQRTSARTQTVHDLLVWPACWNAGWVLTNWNSASSHFLRNPSSKKPNLRYR